MSTELSPSLRRNLIMREVRRSIAHGKPCRTIIVQDNVLPENNQIQDDKSPNYPGRGNQPIFYVQVSS